MTATEFYEKMNDWLLSCGISQSRRGYNAFIRISYRKYMNPDMKMISDGGKTNFKPFYKILASLRLRGKMNEYTDLIYGK